jgi:tetratricopeptide (TPR) repeat protein
LINRPEWMYNYIEMCKKIFTAILLFVSLSAFLAAQDYTVEYIDGFVDVKVDGEWYELYIGDSVSMSDVVSLETGAVLELSRGGKVITLTKPGVYSMSDVGRQAKLQDTSGVDSLIGGKLKTLVGGGSGSGVEIATVAGARGADAGGTDDFGWVESEVDEIIKSGKSSIAAGDIEGALDLFYEAYDYALDNAEEAQALFYIGYAYDLLGKPADALRQLRDVAAEPASEIYTDFYLLKGKLHIETYDYDQAVSFLQAYDDTYASPEEKQTVFFLTGVAYDGLGQAQAADGYFQKAYSLDPHSDVGKTSNSLLHQ